MTDIPPAIFAYNLRRNVFVECERQDLGNLTHGQSFARADVDHLTSRWLFGSCDDSTDHIAHVHKVPLLLAVLKDQWRTIVEQAGTENRRHASVWVGKRLTRSIDVEKTQGSGRDAIGGADAQAHLFLVAFVDG